MAAQGLLLCDDLLFASKVLGTASALKLAVRVAKTPAVLLDLAGQTSPTCVILDLHCPGLDLASLIARLAEVCPAARVVGYGSHVEAATLHAARLAGCDPVLPRSRFVEELPANLAAWLG